MHGWPIASVKKQESASLIGIRIRTQRPRDVSKCVNKVDAQKAKRPLFLDLRSVFEDVLSEWLAA